MIGTEEEPIEMFPGAGFENYVVQIYGDGAETLKYCEIINPLITSVNSCDHCLMTQNYAIVYHRGISAGEISTFYSLGLKIGVFSNSQLRNINSAWSSRTGANIDESISNLYLDCDITDTGNSIEKNVTDSVFQGGRGVLKDESEYPYLTKLAKIPAFSPTFTEPVTYDGAASKYVFMNPYNGEECSYDLAKAVAASLGGTLACFNDSDEEDFLYEQLYLKGEETRKEGGTSSIYTYAYIGYTYDEETGGFVWEDSADNNYEPKAYKSTWTNDPSKPYAYIEVAGDADYNNKNTSDSKSSYSSTRHILEFPAGYSDEEITDALNSFHNATWLGDYYRNVDNCAVL